MAGPVKIRGRGAALAALRRGRPHPAPLYPAARQGRRDRQGRAARAQPLRRPARAVLPPQPRPARGPQRPAHRDGGRDRRRLSAPARARRGARHRRARVRRGRRACSTPPSRIPASTTCSATSSRCSTPSRRAPGTPTSSPSASSSCSPPASRRSWPPAPSCGEREHLSGLLGRGRRRRVPRLRGGLASRWTRRRTPSWSTPSAGRWPTTPAADERALRQAERAIADTLEHHAGIRWRHAVAR